MKKDMKVAFGVFAFACALTAFGDAEGSGKVCSAPFWEDPLVNSENRLPSRTRAVPLADERAALTDALEFETPYVKPLNGRWKVRWTGTAGFARNVGGMGAT